MSQVRFSTNGPVIQLFTQFETSSHHNLREVQVVLLTEYLCTHRYRYIWSDSSMLWSFDFVVSDHATGERG